MTARLNPYLNFRGNAREAMEFYHSVFGGELTVSSFADFGLAEDPAEADQVMHAQLSNDAGFWLMGADTPSRIDLTPNGTVSLSGDDDVLLRGHWAALADGAMRIVEPLEVAPWGDAFGMVIDKFGVFWLVNISAGE